MGDLIAHSKMLRVEVFEMHRIDFVSRFPPRQLEPRILELELGTFKIESGACDLPPEGSKTHVWIGFGTIS